MIRAREDIAGLKMADAAKRVSRYMLTSVGTISRLEQLPETPAVASRRALAAALLFIYGLDPQPFGVGRDDLPPAIYAELARRPSSACLTVDELRAATDRLTVAA
jgi:hypothetical protein